MPVSPCLRSHSASRSFGARTLGDADADPRHRRLGLRRRRARRRACARTGHAVRGFARSRRARRGGRVDDARRSATRSTGAGLDAALDGVDVAYYLIHSMEGAGGGGVRRPRARGGRALRGRGGRRPACGGSSTSAACVPADGAALAPPRLAAGGRGGAAGRRAGVDRAARLDRDRRALALVPLPRAADRAPARAGAARLARATAPRRSTGATCSSSSPRAATAPTAARRRGRGTSAART